MDIANREGIEKEIKKLFYEYMRTHSHIDDVLIYVDAFTYEYLTRDFGYSEGVFLGCEIRPLELFNKAILIQRRSPENVIKDAKYHLETYKREQVKKFREIRNRFSSRERDANGEKNVSESNPFGTRKVPVG